MRSFSRQWFRFSLRTALLMLTLGAVWLGWQVNQIRRQRLVIEWIEKSGGSVDVRRHNDGSAVLAGPAWMRRLMGNDGLQIVDSVALFGDPTELIREVGVFRHLEYLMVWGDGLTDAELTWLADMSSLRKIDIRSRRFSDNGITDKGMEYLARWKRATLISATQESRIRGSSI